MNIKGFNFEPNFERYVELYGTERDVEYSCGDYVCHIGRYLNRFAFVVGLRTQIVFNIYSTKLYIKSIDCDTIDESNILQTLKQFYNQQLIDVNNWFKDYIRKTYIVEEAVQ